MSKNKELMIEIEALKRANNDLLQRWNGTYDQLEAVRHFLDQILNQENNLPICTGKRCVVQYYEVLEEARQLAG